jgi:hypothetical protein
MPQQPGSFDEDMASSAVEYDNDTDARSPPSSRVQGAHSHSSAAMWSDSSITGDSPGEASQQLSSDQFC